MIRGIYRKAFIAVLLLVIVIDLLYFMRRNVLSVDCNLAALLRGRSESSELGSADTATSQETVAGLEENKFGVPYEYTDKVDLRVVVLTMERWESLLKLLNSLTDMRMDGDTAALEIWLDRDRKGAVNERTLQCAQSFRWRHGVVRVHVQPTHVGIYGQWIDTWRPSRNSSELALILEDDLSVSPYAYRWLKAAHAAYGNRSNVVGYTLQSEDVVVASSGAHFPGAPTSQIAFFYRLMGSWGFAPRAEPWRNFQDWYHSVSNERSFRPYVGGIVMTRWYRQFERQHKADSMWTMWFIHYCNAHHLLTLYNNLNNHNNDTISCLSVNRKEPGLHFKGKSSNNTTGLLRTWSDDFINFPADLYAYDFNGKLLTS